MCTLGSHSGVLQYAKVIVGRARGVDWISCYVGRLRGDLLAVVFYDVRRCALYDLATHNIMDHIISNVSDARLFSIVVYPLSAMSRAMLPCRPYRCKPFTNLVNTVFA